LTLAPLLETDRPRSTLVAGITYVRLAEGFCPHLISQSSSTPSRGTVVGYALAIIGGSLAVGALDMAIAARTRAGPHPNVPIGGVHAILLARLRGAARRKRGF